MQGTCKQRSLQRLDHRYEQMGGAPPTVEPRYQMVPFEQETQYLITSPPTGTPAMQAIQDLPLPPALQPREPTVKQSPLGGTEQLHLMLTETSVASSQEPSMTPA